MQHANDADEHGIPGEAVERILPRIQPEIASQGGAITRQGTDEVLSQEREAEPFLLAVSNGNGTIRRDLARAVIDDSGTRTTPNPLGEGGILAEGEAEHADRMWIA